MENIASLDQMALYHQYISRMISALIDAFCTIYAADDCRLDDWLYYDREVVCGGAIDDSDAQ